MDKSAVISSCGKYRYRLTRGDLKNPLVFIMLNPSTADANTDDATIRRCIGFADALGFSGIVVLNLYCYRATKPEELRHVPDPVGRYADHALDTEAEYYKNFLCAWGNNAEDYRVKEVMAILDKHDVNLYCLGTNKNNSPKHPLYISKDTSLIPWRYENKEK